MSALIFCLLIAAVSCGDINVRYRPRYHLAPPNGWMNDPNGFVYFQDNYHLFFQYNPLSSLVPGVAHWGHAVSTDLYHWDYLPISLYPDEPYDRTGVFSGSGITHNGTLYVYYTGNVNNPGLDPDHKQTQNLAYSDDGVVFNKYSGNPVIFAPSYQPNIRDPKVWYNEDTQLWYMVLGNRQNDLGRVLIYYSADLVTWNEGGVLAESTGPLGYMWECPDFFELNGKFVLLFSPQGVLPEGDSYRNLYQTGYIVGDFDYETFKFKQLTSFVELDSGHDFYATQSILSPDNERIVIAWFDMWEQIYPEREDGWTGMMTIPRILTLDKNLKLKQKPWPKIDSLIYNTLTSSKNLSIKEGIQLEDNAAVITVKAPAKKSLELSLVSDAGTVYIAYEPKKGRVTFDRGLTDGVRRAYYSPKSGDFKMKVFVDASSIEIFLGDGDATISSRFFPSSPVVVTLTEAAKDAVVQIDSLARSVPYP